MRRTWLAGWILTAVLVVAADAAACGDDQDPAPKRVAVANGSVTDAAEGAAAPAPEVVGDRQHDAHVHDWIRWRTAEPFGEAYRWVCELGGGVWIAPTPQNPIASCDVKR